MRVFLDTGFLIARIDEGDQWHQRARQAGKVDYVPFTSPLVINEAVTLLQYRGFFSAALEFLREIRSNAYTELVYVDPGIQAEAWQLFSRYGAGGASVVDCSSFAIMRRLDIRQAFTFDRHFRAAGFEIL